MKNIIQYKNSMMYELLMQKAFNVHQYQSAGKFSCSNFDLLYQLKENRCFVRGLTFEKHLQHVKDCIEKAIYQLHKMPVVKEYMYFWIFHIQNTRSPDSLADTIKNILEATKNT